MALSIACFAMFKVFALIATSLISARRPVLVIKRLELGIAGRSLFT
jgi:hypothetical protein